MPRKIRNRDLNKNINSLQLDSYDQRVSENQPEVTPTADILLRQMSFM